MLFFFSFVCTEISVVYIVTVPYEALLQRETHEKIAVSLDIMSLTILSGPYSALRRFTSFLARHKILYSSDHDPVWSITGSAGCRSPCFCALTNSTDVILRSVFLRDGITPLPKFSNTAFLSICNVDAFG